MGSKWDRDENNLLGINWEFDGEKNRLKTVLEWELKTGSKLRFKWEW